MLPLPAAGVLPLLEKEGVDRAAPDSLARTWAARVAGWYRVPLAVTVNGPDPAEKGPADDAADDDA